jgi:hypothetical protein
MIDDIQHTDRGRREAHTLDSLRRARAETVLPSSRQLLLSHTAIVTDVKERVR